MPHPDPLPESLRREYLQALGIDCYMPRVQLPGAPVSGLASIASSGDVDVETAAQAQPPSSEQKVDKQPSPEPVSTRAAKTEPSVAPETGDKKATVNVVADQEVKAAEQAQEETTAPSTSSVPPIKGEEVKLQLLCIRVGEGKTGVAVIAALPHLGPSQLGPRHQALLVNLLRACGIPAGDMEFEEKPFRWPMVTGLHVDNSRRAAASALKAYLLQKHADWHFGNLLVMGEGVVSRLFEPTEDKDGVQMPEKVLEQDQWNLIYTRSLDEILQRPGLKKDVWLEIRKRFSK